MTHGRPPSLKDVTISVSFAKYKGRTSLWRIKKNTNSGANPTWDVPVRAAQGQTTIPVEVIGKAALGVNYEANGGDGCSVGESVEGASGLVNTNCPNGGFRKDNTKRIKGHVDDELLWNYSQCLVGTMGVFSNSEAIMTRLHSWGLGDIKVKHIGGYQYLITINDKELFKMLEDLNWSYLKEVFTEVILWSPSFKPIERMTWIMISGLLVHCWNDAMLKNVASLWGNLEGLGENANQTQNCESVSLLIATKHVEFINEIIEVEIGSEVFKVRVSELSPWIIGSRVLKINDCPTVQVNLVSEESSSEEIVLKNCFDASPGKNVADSDDTLNVLFMGKEDLSKRGEAEEYMVNSLGERDINGVVKSNVNLVDDIENSNLKSPRNSGSPPMNDISNGGADELGVKSGLSENGVVSSSDKVMEDILATGFNKGDLENEAGPTLELLNKETGEFKSNKQVSWADVVLQNTNSGNTGDSGEDMVHLQETMKNKFERDEISYLWPNDDFKFCWSPGYDHSGGLLSVWDKAKFQLDRLDECSKNISESLRNLKVVHCELPDKLKEVKKALKIWRSNNVTRSESCINELMQRLKKIENELDMVGHKEKIPMEQKSVRSSCGITCESMRNP
ncbi:hypothetical protein V6N13_028473 [Hibiscus sabdariffa]